MKNQDGYGCIKIVTVAMAIAVILAACAATPAAPPGGAELRSKLMLLKSEPTLANQAPVAIEQAENAVALAEKPQHDAELAAHRIYMADRMIDTARATAETRLAEAQRPVLKQQSNNDRLTARTLEADAAKDAAVTARAEAATARNAADAARSDANVARNDASAARSDANAARSATEVAAADAAVSEAQKQELARQVALLQARTTERGIVLTLGDVLFSTGSSSLKDGTIGNLDRLVTFMSKYGDRTASIEGYTDSVGTRSHNQDLSLRRANSVKAYLDSHGVASRRLTSIGKGEDDPVASNESAAGRQQNRRVEIIIQNELPAVAATR